MKHIRFLSIIAALVIAFCLCPETASFAAEDLTVRDIKPEDAAAEVPGLPEDTFAFDFTKFDFSCYGVKEFTVAATVPSDVKNISLSVGDAPVARYSIVGYQRGKSTEYSFYEDGINFLGDYNMVDLGNESGKIGVVYVSFERMEKEESAPSSSEPVKIDSFRLVVHKNPGKLPEFTSSVPEVIDQTAEKPLQLDKMTAYDEFEKRELPVTMRWEGEKGVDENGLTVEGGPYKLILEAENSFGNKAVSEITVKVRPKDTEAPVILVNTDEISEYAGTYGSMLVEGTDNEDFVDVSFAWSHGALDSDGRLVAGEHELHLFAQDLTGNKTEKIIKVHVAEMPEGGIVPANVTRDESQMSDARFGLPYWTLFVILPAGIALIGAALSVIIIKLRSARAKRQ